MRKYFENLVLISTVLFVVGCATTAPSNLVVNVDPIEPSELAPSTSLAEVFVDDERTQETGWSERQALGVTMGTISFEPNEVELIKRTLEAELTTLLEQRGYQSKQFYISDLLEFYVETPSTALYWDIIGRVKVRLTLRDQTLDLYGTNTERTYSWPGEEIIERVVQNSLAQMATELENAFRELPSDELAGLPERPSDWAELKAEQGRLAELGLPAGMELPDDQALIYVYRPSRVLGSANAYKILVNDKHVTNVLDGGRFPYVFKPGGR